MSSVAARDHVVSGCSGGGCSSSFKLEGSAEVIVHVFKHNKIFSCISGTYKTVFQVFLEIRDDQCRYGGRCRGNDENK